MDQLKSVLLSFLRWWLGELRACLPSRLRRFLTASRNRLVFDVSDSVVVVMPNSGDAVLPKMLSPPALWRATMVLSIGATASLKKRQPCVVTVPC